MSHLSKFLLLIVVCMTSNAFASDMVFRKIPAIQFYRTLHPSMIRFEDPEYDKVPYQVQFQIRIPRSFEISETEVTNEQWNRVMGTSGGESNMPRVSVSWNETREFLKRLSALDGRKYRLPTYAEWESIAKGSRESYFFWGTRTDSRYYNSTTKVQAVGLTEPNRYGVRDLVGNVWEWTEDHVTEEMTDLNWKCFPQAVCKSYRDPFFCYSPSDIETDPRGFGGPRRRIAGGGIPSGRFNLDGLRAYPPDFRSDSIGIRVVREL